MTVLIEMFTMGLDILARLLFNGTLEQLLGAFAPSAPGDRLPRVSSHFLHNAILPLAAMVSKRHFNQAPFGTDSNIEMQQRLVSESAADPVETLWGTRASLRHSDELPIQVADLP